MRYLLFVFLFIFSLNVSAQSSKVTQLFSDGTTKASQSHFADALRSYETALTIAENEYLDAGFRARLRFNIGVCYFRLENYDRAAENFKRAILLKKDYANAHNALNVAEARRRDWKRTTASIKASGQ